MLRPAMSRVVAMLEGDIEVSTVASKPSYLTDWDVNDGASGLLSEDTQTSFASNKCASHPTPSPVNIASPMLHGNIGEGR